MVKCRYIATFLVVIKCCTYRQPFAFAATLFLPICCRKMYNNKHVCTKEFLVNRRLKHSEEGTLLLKSIIISNFTTDIVICAWFSMENLFINIVWLLLIKVRMICPQIINVNWYCLMLLAYPQKMYQENWPLALERFLIIRLDYPCRTLRQTSP